MESYDNRKRKKRSGNEKEKSKRHKIKCGSQADAFTFPAHSHFLRPVNLTPLGSRKKRQQIVAFGQRK